MQRVKSGDTVQIIAGKDIGERGVVEAVMPKIDRVVVQGVNVLKRHRKARQVGTQQIPAQIVEFDGPIHLSNVMPVCPKCDKPTRVGFRVRDDDFKTRVCRNCNADMD